MDINWIIRTFRTSYSCCIFIIRQMEMIQRLCSVNIQSNLIRTMLKASWHIINSSLYCDNHNKKQTTTFRRRIARAHISGTHHFFFLSFSLSLVSVSQFPSPLQLIFVLKLCNSSSKAHHHLIWWMVSTLVEYGCGEAILAMADAATTATTKLYMEK